MVEVTDVSIVENRSVHLLFSDGCERTVDLTPFLWGPMFEDIARDDATFAQVRADPQRGTIAWPNGADIDPDVLHGDDEPSWAASRRRRTTEKRSQT